MSNNRARRISGHIPDHSYASSSTVFQRDSCLLRPLHFARIQSSIFRLRDGCEGFRRNCCLRHPVFRRRIFLGSFGCLVRLVSVGWEDDWRLAVVHQSEKSGQQKLLFLTSVWRMCCRIRGRTCHCFRAERHDFRWKPCRLHTCQPI